MVNIVLIRDGGKVLLGLNLWYIFGHICVNLSKEVVDKIVKFNGKKIQNTVRLDKRWWGKS